MLTLQNVPGSKCTFPTAVPGGSGKRSCSRRIEKGGGAVSRKRILLADDSAVNRELLHQILRDQYRVTECGDGSEAIDILRRHSGEYSLVILDMLMPGKDGFDVLEYMNRKGLLSRIPVIMISSETSAPYIFKAHEQGVTDFICRPFEPGSILKRISDAIDKDNQVQKMRALKELRVRNRHILRMMWRYMVILAVIAVVLGATLLLTFQHTRLRENEIYLSEMGRAVASALDTRIAARMNTLSSYAYMYERNMLPLDEIKKVGGDAGFAPMFILTPDGRVSFGSQNFEADLGDRAMDVLDGERVADWSNDEHNSLINGMFLIVPVYDRGEVVSGLGSFMTDEWSESFLNEELVGGLGNIYMFNDNMDAITIGGVMTKLDLHDSDDVTYMRGYSYDELTAAIEARREYVFLRRHDGRKWVTAVIPMETSKSYLLVEIDENEIAAPLERFNVMAIVSIGTLVIVALLLCILIMRVYGMLNREVSQMAFVDPVTGGNNRTNFDTEASARITEAEPGTYNFLTFDLGGFSLINNRYGIAVGDKVLKHVHDSVSRLLPEGSILCRESNDAFSVLYPKHDRAVTEKRWLEMIREINDFGRESSLSDIMRDNPYLISVKIGVYEVCDPEESLIMIRDRANLAKKSRHARMISPLVGIGYYSDYELQSKARAKEFETRLEPALKNGEFAAFLQPKLDLRSGKVTGAEALIRWNDPRRGIIGPDEFIPVLERSGSVAMLDFFVFEQACRYIRKWIDEGVKPIRISSNFSRIHLKNADFIHTLTEIREKYGVPAYLLEIEITETVVFEDIQTVIKTVNLAHEAGFACAIDDFGSGYSSLNMLTDISSDVVKLDKSFFRDGKMSERSNRTIIESVIGMCKKLGVLVVAEGIETDRQLEFLRGVQCDYIQGYLLSKPIDVGEFESRFMSGETAREED